MAKSLDKEKMNNTINDDLIKEALKTGLSSIKASDYLVNQTLLKCQKEITNEKQEKKFNLLLWMYKLGAPLAAGALVLVLLINTNGLRMKNSTAEMAPTASAAPNAQALNGVSAKAEDSVGADVSSAEPSSEGAYITESVQGNMDVAFSQSIRFSLESIDVLNSSVNREPNRYSYSDGEKQVFAGFVDLYNENNASAFILEEKGITRISSIVKTGVDANMLKNSKAYGDILTDEGYWALPLKNEGGLIEKVLTVNAIDSNNPDATISSQDVTYSFNGNKLIVSEIPDGAYIGSELKALFDLNAIEDIFTNSGFTINSEVIIADINYGMDFIALTDTGQQKLVIPFLTNVAAFGVENKKVYLWDEFVKIVSESMKQ